MVQEPAGQLPLKQHSRFCDMPVSPRDSRSYPPAAGMLLAHSTSLSATSEIALAEAGHLDQGHDTFLGQSSPNDWLLREQKGLASLLQLRTILGDHSSFRAPHPTMRSPEVFVETHHSPTSPSTRTCFLPFFSPSVNAKSSSPPPQETSCTEIPLSGSAPQSQCARSTLTLPQRDERKASDLGVEGRRRTGQSQGHAGKETSVCIAAQSIWLCLRSHGPRVAPWPTWEDREWGASGRKRAESQPGGLEDFT